jgi:Ca2+-binding EF-hand superfamily protein
MNTQAQGKANGGFTLVEVTLAVGIVAFGLVAIFSILPFGLTAQKDNQEDTIFRYEAEYWFTVLQAGGLPLDSLNRVETIELWKNPDDNWVIHGEPMDTDGDGKIILSEVENFLLTGVQAYFNTLDVNGDTIITENEPINKEVFKAADTDANGELTLLELKGYFQPVKVYFNTLDADLSGALDKNELNQPYRINRFDLSVEQAGSWPADVCGWLSAPNNKVDRKYAYVRAINGPLYDRLNGLRHRPNILPAPPEYYLPGGEFAFGYILETRVVKQGQWMFEITLTFHWPISESAGNALNSLDSSMDSSIHQIMEDVGMTPVKNKTFSIQTALSPEPALMEINLNPQQLQFLHTGLPGDVIYIADLKTGPLFETRYSNNLWDGFKRKLKINSDGLGEVFIDVNSDIVPTVPALWKNWPQCEATLSAAKLGKLSEAFSGNDIGWHVKIGLNTFRIAEVSSVNGHYIQLENPKELSTPISFPYYVEFLNTGLNSNNPTWERLLNSYERLGLVEGFIDPDTGEEELKFGSTYKSGALPWLRNRLFGGEFSTTEDYGQVTPGSLESTECSFWFLR